MAQGAKLLNRYNCTGCHVLEMPKYTIAAGTKLDEALTDFQTNVQVSYNNRATDFLGEFYPRRAYDAKKKPELSGDDGKPIVIEGMPIGTFENELTVQLWQPVTIRGFTFNVGDNLTLDRTKVEMTPPKGGTSPGSSPPTRPNGPGTSSRRSGTGCRRRCCARGRRSRPPG